MKCPYCNSKLLPFCRKDAYFCLDCLVEFGSKELLERYANG